MYKAYIYMHIWEKIFAQDACHDSSNTSVAMTSGWYHLYFNIKYQVEIWQSIPPSAVWRAPKVVAAAATAKIENSRRLGRLDSRSFRTRFDISFDLNLTLVLTQLDARFELDSTSVTNSSCMRKVFWTSVTSIKTYHEELSAMIHEQHFAVLLLYRR